MVGTEDLPPANGAAISGGIAPEVAEIAGAGEIEVAGRRIWHGGSLSRALRRRNDGEGVSLALVYTGLPRGRHASAQQRYYLRLGIIRRGSCSLLIAGVRADVPELSLRRRLPIHRGIFRI